MSKPTAAMELMFSERLQKMRDPIGTAYVEGEGGDKGSGSLVRRRDVFFESEAPFLECVSPVEATSAIQRLPRPGRDVLGEGVGQGATWVTWRARRAWCPRWPRATPRRSARRARRRPEEQGSRARAREVSSHRRDRRRRADASGGRYRVSAALRTRRRACARTRRSRARRTRTTHGTVCVWCRSVARTTRSPGGGAPTARPTYSSFSRVTRKLRWNDWLDAPDVTDRL